MVFDSRGRLWVADRGNQRIVRYGLDDKPIEVLEGRGQFCHFQEHKDLIVVPDLGSKVHILKGKHRPDYTPHVDCGDYIIVINAEKVRFTGKKMDAKTYLTYSGYPGGQKSATPRELLARIPTRVVEVAVRKMLPKHRLGDAMFKKLFIYAGPEHYHQAQKPEIIKL